MKLTYLTSLLIMILISKSLIGQESYNSGANSITTSNGSLSYSIGQTFYQTWTNIEEGVQHPLIFAEDDLCETPDPFQLVEAESFCSQQGILIGNGSEGEFIGWTHGGDYINFKNVDFGLGAGSISLRVASFSQGGEVEIRLDALDGPLVVSCNVSNTGGWQNWQTNTYQFSKITDIHDVYFVFKGESNLMNINWFQFNPIISTLIIQENEEGFCSVDGTIDSNHSGFTGTGFANSVNEISSSTTWEITGSAGVYEFSFRYASFSDRPIQLEVNEEIINETLDFNSTGSWSVWDTTQVFSTSLDEGLKRVMVVANTFSGLANIDFMQVTGPNISTVNCSTGPSSLENISKAIISSFPNPTTDELHIENLNTGAFIYLYDQLGTRWSSLQAKEDNETIDIRNLPNGIYTLVITDKENTTTSKIIIK